MPVTRRRRANPPEPENNNNHLAEQAAEAPAEATAAGPTAEAGQEKKDEKQAQSAPNQPEVSPAPAPVTENVPPPSFTPQQPITRSNSMPHQGTQLPLSLMNGDRAERLERLERERLERERLERERIERGERPDYISTIEGGRRTARGELFRRPPQPPVQQPSIPAAVSITPPLQPPSHEISLPLGNLLHLAYNPSYTGSDEARSALLQQLQSESKSGGRARCWSCGSLGVFYDRWSTRSKTFGEVGVAYCEICGVWSVM